MTDTTETPTIYATLVRGRYHDYAGKVWNVEEGKHTHLVTEAERAYLTEHAIDRKTVDDKEERIQKFDFSDTPPEEGEEEEEQPAPRVRRRSRSQ